MKKKYTLQISGIRGSDEAIYMDITREQIEQLRLQIAEGITEGIDDPELLINRSYYPIRVGEGELSMLQVIRAN